MKDERRYWGLTSLSGQDPLASAQRQELTCLRRELFEVRKESDFLGIDVVCFHLYGIERDEVDYIMDTFRIVRPKDEADFGEYRTNGLILERYDEMTTAITSGDTYATALDPPPGDPRCSHVAE